MDLSPSAHSPDVRESRPSFRKPGNEASRRNYRRHSPSSSRSRTPSPGGWKRDRSPSCVSQEDEISKKGRNSDLESDKGRGDARFRRGTDTGLRSYGNYCRDRHGRAEDHDHNYNRRHTSYHDRNFYNSGHARADYSRYDDGRYARQSPERSARERIVEEAGYRRRENRSRERDRDRDDRISDIRAADRDKIREDELDVRDRYKTKDREARQRGRERFVEKERDADSDVEAERSRHGKRIDDGYGRRDVNDVEGRDHDTDKGDGKERHKSKPDPEKLKDKESRRREREEGKGLENDKDEGSRHRSRDKGHRAHDEHRKKSDISKEYSSDEPEGTRELLRERSHRQDISRKGVKDKKQSGEKAKANHTSFERLGSVQGAGASVAISDHSDESKRLDEKYIKGSKWGPEAETSDTTAASSDPEVAKLAAMKAAALVNINLGGLKSVDEKKKMLWGSKEQKPAAASGTNRWDTVRFADRDRQEKFHKLMGVKGEAGEGGSGTADTLFTTEKQEELQQDLEKQFTAGLRRRDGRTVGLGL